jgi:hypothetical protein
MKMNFQWQNHNDFKTPISWHDYVSVIVNEFPILLVRRYDWFSTDETTVLIQIFGFRIK